MVMQIPTKAELKRLKEMYLSKRIELVSMRNDPNPIKPGTKGKVIGIDDLGSLIVNWDNGRKLNVLVLDGDEVKPI